MPPLRRRLRLEALEDRCVPTFPGSLDLTFSGDGKTTVAFTPSSHNSIINALAVQADGKVILVGDHTVFGSGTVMGVARLNRDGSPDATFGTNGIRTLDFAEGTEDVTIGQAVVVLPDGKILIAGTTEHPTQSRNFIACRLLPNGALDTTFGNQGVRHIDFAGSFDACNSMALQANGKIVLAGQMLVNGSSSYGVARLNYDGSLDTTFGGSGTSTVGFDSTTIDNCEGMLTLADGKIVLACSVRSTGPDTSRFGVARLEANGSLDPSFGNAGRALYSLQSGNTGENFEDIAVGPDGKLVLVGSIFREGGKDFDIGVVRALPNGALDTSFAGTGSVLFGFDLPGSSKADFASGVEVQPDGKVVVAGTASVVGGDADFLVARFNANGSVDTTFNPPTGSIRYFFDVGGNKQDVASTMLLAAEGIYVAGSAVVNANGDRDFAVLRIVSDVLPLENAWGSVEMAPPVPSTGASSDPDSNFVRDLYRALLGREADQGGLTHWLRLMYTGSRQAVIDGIFTSGERLAYCVGNAYRTVLGRDAAAAEVGGWVEALRRGLSERDMLALMFGSSEFARAQASSTAFLQAVYRILLGREADAAGLTAWAGALGRGVSRQAVVQAFLRTGEYTQRAVHSLFVHYLGRKPDGGSAGWVELARAFGSPAAAHGILSSGEFASKRRA